MCSLRTGQWRKRLPLGATRRTCCGPCLVCKRVIFACRSSVCRRMRRAPRSPLTRPPCVHIALRMLRPSQAVSRRTARDQAHSDLVSAAAPCVRAAGKACDLKQSGRCAELRRKACASTLRALAGPAGTQASAARGPAPPEGLTPCSRPLRAQARRALDRSYRRAGTRTRRRWSLWTT